MRLGIDLDGVMADWVDGMRRHFVARGRSPHALPPPTVYEFWPQWGMTKGEFMDGWTTWAEGGGWETLEPIPGAIDGARMLAEMGHTLHIVTARSRTARGIASTARWLERHGVPFKSLAFDSDKAHHPMDMWVEDSTANAVAIAAAGGQPVLFDQPWNEDAPSYICRAIGWGDVVELVHLKDQAITQMWAQAQAWRHEP